MFLNIDIYSTSDIISTISSTILNVHIVLESLMVDLLQEMSSRLDLIIQSRSLSGFDALSSFEDLMESVRNLLEELCENQLPHPYLITVLLSH